MSEGVQENCISGGFGGSGQLEQLHSGHQHDLQEQQLVLLQGLEVWGRLNWQGAAEKQKE